MALGMLGRAALSGLLDTLLLGFARAGVIGGNAVYGRPCGGNQRYFLPDNPWRLQLLQDPALTFPQVVIASLLQTGFMMLAPQAHCSHQFLHHLRFEVLG